jgi:hypothetical protein
MIVFWLGTASVIVGLALIERRRRRRLIRRMATGEAQPEEYGVAEDAYGPDAAAASIYNNIRNRG